MYRSVEDQFESDLRWTAARIRNLLGRRPLIYYRLIADHGGIGAAKRLLAETQFREWFARLLQEERLDLSIESHVLRPRYRHLFDEMECRIAEERLTVGGFLHRDWEPVERRTWCRIRGPQRRRRTSRGLGTTTRRRRARLRHTLHAPRTRAPRHHVISYPDVAPMPALRAHAAHRRMRKQAIKLARRRPDLFSVRRWRRRS